MNLRRVWRIVRKEIIQTLRDRRMLAILFVAPILQLFIFGYAVSTDINNIITAVYDEDHSATSREFIDTLIQSRYFTYKYYLESPQDVNRVLDSGQAQVVVHIPRSFAEDLAHNRTAQLQTILDGSDSMSALVISGYVDAVLQRYSAAISNERLLRQNGSLTHMPGIEGRLRVWYNPELKSVNFMVPGVLCMILMIITTMMTSLAIVKEKEIGTLEQLVVTPISSAELMLGKTLPFLFAGLLDMVLVLLVAVSWFHVHVVGSVLLLFILSILFLFTTLGLGIFISTVSKTQQEATLTSFFFFLPFILLSGFMFPIENMPEFVRWITYAIPLRYFLDIIRGIFLKGVGLNVLWPQVIVLACYGIGIITLSALRFQKRIG
ncbi:MAG TPA: ABC transporter permease [Armatimonadota bacterium]|nr:ABC transporter permease [Armatimonadota bacterium]